MLFVIDDLAVAMVNYQQNFIFFSSPIITTGKKIQNICFGVVRGCSVSENSTLIEMLIGLTVLP